MEHLAPELLLKLSPPRVSRQFQVREGLRIGTPALWDAPALLLQAPGGFGKTSLLAHWRLELIAQGAIVAWVSNHEQDDGRRLLDGLVHGLRRAAALPPSFGQGLVDATLPPGEGLTLWLAEVTQLALDLVLVLDDVDRLSAEGREMVAYLLRNQPPNLRVLVAARQDCRLQIDDLIGYGRVLRLGVEQLSFGLAESLALARRRLGDGVDLDRVARLHGLCEGWPLGLQLLLGANTAGAALDALAPASSSLPQALLDLVFAQLAPDDLALLEDIAVADQLHTALCVALSGRADAAERLARLAAETPLIVYAEQGDWLRLHVLARERMRERLRLRPPEQRQRLHRLASEWLAGRGLLEEAARHAWEAGEHPQALALAERSLYEALVLRGRHSLALEWLERLPEAALQAHPRLQLTAAWTLSISERHAAAGRLVEAMLARAGDDEVLVFECRLILGAAAVYADQPDRFAALHDGLDGVPDASPALLRQIYARRGAWREHLLGEPARARLLLRQQRAEPEARDPGAADHWTLMVTALSHLWEGQVRLVEGYLRPALARLERESGRRSSLATMLAAVLAAALWERGDAAEATALLADRLDVLERSTLPQTVVLGFCTALRMASAAGAEGRALELIAALDALGQTRDLPRLRLISLAEQLRLHARGYRAETCRALLRELNERLADPALPSREQAPVWWAGVELSMQLARSHAAIAAHDWRGAARQLEPLVQQARTRRLGRLQVEAQGLCAYALDRCGEPQARPLMRDAMALAEGLGLRQVFADAHPDLGLWADQLRADAGAGSQASPPAQPLKPAPAPSRLRVVPSMVLTPKEREVLELLGRRLSNKEIALALQVGDETIKWHVKNLYLKLDAGTRQQAVARARVLGLLVAEA